MSRHHIPDEYVNRNYEQARFCCIKAHAFLLLPYIRDRRRPLSAMLAAASSQQATRLLLAAALREKHVHE